MKRVILVAALFFFCGLLRAENQNLKPDQLPTDGDQKDKQPYAANDAVVLSTTPLRTPAQFIKKIKNLVTGWKAETDPKKRGNLKIQIMNSTPRNAEEVDELFDLAEAEKGEEVQRDILESMGYFNDASLGPLFHKRLKKGDYNVRAVAIKKIAELKHKAAVPDLIKVVENFDYWKDQGNEDEAMVSLYAFFALGDIGDDRAIPVVMGKLGKMNGQDEQVISRFGNKVLPQLLDVARTSKDKKEKESAYIAINGIRDRDTMLVFWQIVQQDKDARLRSACTGALLSMATDNTNPSRTQLEDYVYTKGQNDKETFGMGYYAVLAARTNRNIKYLERIAADGKVLRNQRTDAIDALGDFKAQSAIPILENLLKESNKEIRMTAADALKKITGKDYNWELK